VFRDGALGVFRGIAGRVFGCAAGAGRQIVLTGVLRGAQPTGPATDFHDRDRVLSYRFPAQTASGAATALVVLDLTSGRLVRSVLAPSNITEWAAGPVDDGFGATTIAYTDGVTLTVVNAHGTRVADTGAIHDLAISDNGANDLGELFWTNANKANALTVFNVNR
jgi:hypothetical protein